MRLMRLLLVILVHGGTTNKEQRARSKETEPRARESPDREPGRARESPESPGEPGRARRARGTYISIKNSINSYL